MSWGWAMTVFFIEWIFWWIEYSQIQFVELIFPERNVIEKSFEFVSFQLNQIFWILASDFILNWIIKSDRVSPMATPSPLPSWTMLKKLQDWYFGASLLTLVGWLQKLFNRRHPLFSRISDKNMIAALLTSSLLSVKTWISQCPHLKHACTEDLFLTTFLRCTDEKRHHNHFAKGLQVQLGTDKGENWQLPCNQD